MRRNEGEMAIITITGARGEIAEPDWLARAEAVHRQLRPGLPQGYAAKMARVFADGGRMSVATLEERVVGVAVYRVFEDTMGERRMYIDDLVTTEGERSRGVGHLLVSHLESVARAAGCRIVTLDSGTQRHRAHAFYFRERYAAVSFHFAKELK